MTGEVYQKAKDIDNRVIELQVVYRECHEVGVFQVCKGGVTYPVPLTKDRKKKMMAIISEEIDELQQQFKEL